MSGEPMNTPLPASSRRVSGRRVSAVRRRAVAAVMTAGLCLAGVLTSLRVQAAGDNDWPQFRGQARDGISAETGGQSTWPADGPRVLWRARVGTGFSSITVSNGRAYTIGNPSGETDVVYCLDARSGRVLWRHSYPSPAHNGSYEGGPN